MDMSTNYLGFKLAHPIIPGASPLADDLDAVKKLEDAGAPMIVLRSLFEEQIVREQLATADAMDTVDHAHAEAVSYLPAPEAFKLGPEQYLNHLAKVKKSVSVPVIASLNGTSEGGWTQYAKLIQQAGADGLELNLYELASDPAESGQQVEERDLQVVRSVRQAVSIPLAVKISPFYSSIANFAKKLDEIGVEGLVMFNRFYQPDIDVEQLEVVRVNLSSSAELLLRIRWMAMLSGRLNAAMSLSGGVHTAVDVIKSVMAGAHSVQVVSSLLHHGPKYLKTLRDGMEQWMREHEYESVKQMRASMSLMRCPNPKAYERANYMQVLQSWEGRE